MGLIPAQFPHINVTQGAGTTQDTENTEGRRRVHSTGDTPRDKRDIQKAPLTLETTEKLVQQILIRSRHDDIEVVGTVETVPSNKKKQRKQKTPTFSTKKGIGSKLKQKVAQLKETTRSRKPPLLPYGHLDQFEQERRDRMRQEREAEKAAEAAAREARFRLNMSTEEDKRIRAEELAKKRKIPIPDHDKSIPVISLDGSIIQHTGLVTGTGQGAAAATGNTLVLTKPVTPRVKSNDRDDGPDGPDDSSSEEEDRRRRESEDKRQREYRDRREEYERREADLAARSAELNAVWQNYYYNQYMEDRAARRRAREERRRAREEQRRNRPPPPVGAAGGAAGGGGGGGEPPGGDEGRDEEEDTEEEEDDDPEQNREEDEISLRGEMITARAGLPRILTHVTKPISKLWDPVHRNNPRERVKAMKHLDMVTETTCTDAMNEEPVVKSLKSQLNNAMLMIGKITQELQSMKEESKSKNKSFIEKVRKVTPMPEEDYVPENELAPGNMYTSAVYHLRQEIKRFPASVTVDETPFDYLFELCSH